MAVFTAGHSMLFGVNTVVTGQVLSNAPATVVRSSPTPTLFAPSHA